jgi:broad specificity phosphatase PhoE
MTRFVLIRHGQTEWNREERYRGRADIALNDTGHQQARRLAATLADTAIAAVYASPLQRCVQTAEPIARQHGLEVQPLEGLLDIHYGRWQGLTPAEAAKGYPKLYHLWLTSPGRVRFPDGEGLDDVRTRATSALAELTNRHAGQTVVLVSHKIVCKIILCAILGLTNDHIWRIEQDNAAINVFQHEDGSWVVLSMNDTCHL